MLKEWEGKEAPRYFLCSLVRLIYLMMTCVERIRRRRGSDIFPVKFSKVDTLDDDMRRKNKKQEGLRYISCVV